LLGDRSGRAKNPRADRIADDDGETKPHSEYAQQVALSFHLKDFLATDERG